MKEQISTMIKEMTLEKLIRQIIIVVSASFVGSFAITCIMIPAGITSGGLPGILRLITHYIPVDFSIATFIGTSLVILSTWIFLGWVDVSKIIALSLAYPVWIGILERTGFALVGPDDKIIAAIFVGVLYGVATGIGYIEGYASGGTDSIVRIIKYRLFKHIPQSTLLLIVDGTVVLLSAFVFDTKIALLAMISTYICSETTRKVMIGINGRLVRLDIITDNPDVVADYILHTVSRGVTSYECVGEYTGQTRRQMYTLCTPKQSLEIKAFLAKNDSSSFVSVMPVDTVWGLGKGFSKIDEVDND